MSPADRIHLNIAPIRAISLLLVVCEARACVAADLGTGPYQVPLLGNYAIYRSNPDYPNASFGRYQLVLVNSLTSRTELATNVEWYAVSGKWIVGETTKGYFIFDAASANATPELFGTREQWRTALRSAGIPERIELSSPDTVAATLPDQVLHPFDYQRMRGWLGLPDLGWAALLQLLGLIVTFACGFFSTSQRSMTAWAVVSAVLVNFVGQFIILTPDGPGLLCWFFITPVVYAYSGYLGKWLGSARMRRRGRDELGSGTGALPSSPDEGSARP